MLKVSNWYVNSGVPEVGQGKRVVLDLIGPVSGTGREICADNFFTSKTLVDILLTEHKLTYVGTTKSNHTGLSPFITDMKNRKPGDTRYAYSGPVQLLSRISKNWKKMLSS